MILFTIAKSTNKEFEGKGIKAIIDPIVVGGSMIPHEVTAKELKEDFPEGFEDEKEDYSFMICLHLQDKEGKIHKHIVGGYYVNDFDKKTLENAALSLKAHIEAANSVISENKNMMFYEFTEKITKYLLNNVTHMN